MEEICAPGNMRAALQRVSANKGSPGSDGMSVEELPAYLRAHWSLDQMGLFRLSASPNS